MQTKITSPVMRYHGAKFRLAEWVMSLFPQHECYVEPFGGAAGVLMQKPRVYAEVYNDLDGEIVNVFRVLRDPILCERLIELCTLTPFARDEFYLAYEPHTDHVEQARRTLFRSQAGFGTGAASGNTSGFRNDAKRSYSLSSHIWARFPDHIARFTERLQGVIIENRPAVDVIAKNDGEQTLFFVDPPYLMDTRNSHGGKVYRHEMTDEEHFHLLQVLLDVKGYVVITGYDHPLYREQLKDWELHTKSARISSGRGTASRIEHAWLNPQCANAMNMPGLFGMGNLVNA